MDRETKDTPALSVSKVPMAPNAMYALYELSASRFRRDQPKQRFFLLLLVEIFENKAERRKKADNEFFNAAPIPLEGDSFPNIELLLGFLPRDAGQQPHALQSLIARGKLKHAGDPYPSNSHGDDITLAFIDDEFWVCTWTWSGTDVWNGSVRRHFLLPRDWLNREHLQLAVLRNDGAILCPKNGEIAVISNGFDTEWVD